MTIEVYGLRADLHSGMLRCGISPQPSYSSCLGVHGGALHEPMVDLVHILSTLIDENGRVLIDGFYDPVAQMTDLEDSYYDDTDFGLDEYVEEVGVHQLRSDGYVEKIRLVEVVSYACLPSQMQSPFLSGGGESRA